jgi:hypothetical protein
MTVKALLLDPQNQVAREAGHKAKLRTPKKAGSSIPSEVLSKVNEDLIAETLGKRLSLQGTTDEDSFVESVTKFQPDILCFALPQTIPPSTAMWSKLRSTVRWSKIKRKQAELPTLFLVECKKSRHVQVFSFVRNMIEQDPSKATDFIVGDFSSKDFWREFGLRSVRILELAKTERASISNITQGLRHLLPELHDRDSGRIDARRVADYFSIPLSHVAQIIGGKVPTIHKTPDAVGLQEKLGKLERIAALLREITTSPDELRSWLNAQNPDFENETPLNVMKAGHLDVVLHLLEDIFVGQPR